MELGKSAKLESVKVAVRVRPLNSIELADHVSSIVHVDKHQVIVHRPNNEQKPFAFDFAYPPNVPQKTVFDEVARPIVDSVINGYNGTIFAYGQTGTGKTFTMEGCVDDDGLRGIMPNTFHHIFKEIERASKHIEYLVRVSFLEIYNDDVFDLLSRDRVKMMLKESNGGFQVKDLSTHTVNSVADTMKVLRTGQNTRSTGATKMNPGSSRSHSIFTITVEMCEKDADNQAHYRVGKLNMVDLAGSERQKKTEASGDRLVEAKNINLSLSALGNVINALVKPKTGHVPFRDSKLTKLLQDSLGGNTKTVMIAAIGPAESNLDETMSTLRYAHRAKGIMNIPTVNEDPKDAILRQYQVEIEELKKQLDLKKQIFSEGAATGIGQMHIQGQVPTALLEKETAEIQRKSKEDIENFLSLHEEEKQRILASKTEAEQTALLYEIELQRSNEQLLKERAEIGMLEKQLLEKETSLLVGGQELEAAEAKHIQLQLTEKRLQEQLEKQRQLQAHLEEAEEAELYMNDKYSNRQDELEKKTKKLKTLWAKYKEKTEDLKDIQNEYETETSDLLESIRDLTRHLATANCLLGELTSASNIGIIEGSSHWDTYTEEWTIPYLDYAGNNIVQATGKEAIRKGHRRMSTYERVAALLDKDARRERAVLNGNTSGNNTAVLKAALQNLKVPLDASRVYYTYSSARVRSKLKKVRTKSSKR